MAGQRGAPTNPTATYIGVRVGRDVRVERINGTDVIGRLAAFAGGILTIENGETGTVSVPVGAVRALWVRG